MLANKISVEIEIEIVIEIEIENSDIEQGNMANAS